MNRDCAVARSLVFYLFAYTHSRLLNSRSSSREIAEETTSMSRMNLQSTGSFVPKKFAALSSSGGGPLNPPPKSGNKFAGAGRSNKPAAKKTTGAPKASSNELNSKEKSMLVMLGIEDDPLICVRSQDTKGNRNGRVPAVLERSL